MKYSMLPLSVKLLLVVVSLLVSVHTTKAQEQVNHTKAQLDWIQHHGGMVSSKIRFDDAGVFATDDIRKDETILVIPNKCLLSGKGTKQRNECGAALNVVKERLKGEESDFAPYINYVFDKRHHGQVPSTWSEDGKQLLTTIIGDEMPPYDVTGVSFAKMCDGHVKGQELLEEEAYQIVMRRGWEEYLVPVYDMLNHRNGRWRNVESNSVKTKDDVVVYALRDIDRGEQLYMSYNECTDCDYALSYTLPHIVKDFGFVEQYPRRWSLDFDRGLVVFELDEDPATPGEIQFTWLTEEPHEHEVRFLRGELERLRDLSSFVSERAAKLQSDHERSVSVEFYDAFTMALDYMLRDVDSDDKDDDDDDDDDDENVSSTVGDKTCPDAA